MWDHFILAAYVFGAGLNVYLIYEIWRQRGACWRVGLGVALVIVFAGLSTDQFNEIRQSQQSAAPSRSP